MRDKPKDRIPYCISIRDAAKILTLDPATVYRMIAAREIPAVQLGPRRLAIRSDELEAWLEARRTIPRDPFPTDPARGKL
jgi:excisionase family DNA binding protein